MQVLEFARSTMTFRIDLDKLPPRTLSHRPPYALNNARVQLDCVCRVTERDTGRIHTIALGASCKTEQVGAAADLWLLPNGDFIPLLSDDHFMQIKTFARAGMMAQLHPPGSGVQSDRQRSPIEGTFDGAYLDLVEREADLLDGPEEIVHAVMTNEVIVGIHRITTERYEAEVEYPVKTINANERDMIYQTDTGPILFPSLECEPDELLSRMELAFSALNAPDWAEFIVRVPTPIAPEIDVFHYAKPVRIEGIVNELYRVRSDGAAAFRRVELPNTV